MHLTVVGVNLAILCQFLACFFELIHLVQYASDGKGYRWRHGRLPLDFLSDTMQNVSEIVTITVVVSVGCGWTLIDGQFRHLKKVAGLAGGVAVFTFMLELISRR